MKIRVLKYFLSIVFVLLGCTELSPIHTTPNNPITKLQPPSEGKIYHAAYPDFGGEEDIVTIERLKSFEKLAGRKITWAYFSNNWTPEKGGIKFSRKEVETINTYGRVPYIRMMPRSEFSEGGPDSNFTMAAIISGKFDKELTNWEKAAKETDIPLLVEFGTEVNGNWFPWNAEFNGKDSKTEYGNPNLFDGMERFRDAYRHIIDICKKNQAIISHGFIM